MTKEKSWEERTKSCGAWMCVWSYTTSDLGQTHERKTNILYVLSDWSCENTRQNVKFFKPWTEKV